MLPARIGPDQGGSVAIELLGNAEDLLAAHASDAGVVGATLAVARGDELEIATYGFADPGGTPVTPDTRFQIASVTKPMVATVISRLVDRGVVTLEDVVSGYIPELTDSPWAQVATVRQLLASTSGIPLTAMREWLAPQAGDASLAEYCAELAADEPMWRPGTVWSYANSGWSVLGRLIECVTGEVWEDAMRAELLEPLGLKGTEFGHERSSGTRSLCFEAGDEGPVPAEDWLRRALGPGGGSLYSTAEDLAKFGRAHCDDPAQARLREDHAPVGISWFLDSWCLGWARFDGRRGSVWGWDGIASGARAFLRVVPDQRGVVALLCNTSTGRDVYRTLFPEIYRKVFGLDIPNPRHEPVAVEDLARYEGRFAWPDMELSVEAEADHLRVVQGDEIRVCRPVDAQNFVIDAPGIDRATVGFSAFEDGVPQVFRQWVWSLPRRP